MFEMGFDFVLIWVVLYAGLTLWVSPFLVCLFLSIEKGPK